MIAMSGPIPVARFMAESNAHYYDTRDPLGADGDFVTAPEISQMFGEMIGLWLVDLAMRAGTADWHLAELGPGRGTLARDALRAIGRFAPLPDLHFVEASATLRSRQQALHPGADWHEEVTTLPRDRPLLVVANEFFDALPVHQFVATHAGWRERVVVREQDRFVPVPGLRPAFAAIPPALRTAPPGSIVESCPAGAAIMRELAERVAEQGGALLVIDYGYAEPAAASTLQAVRAHRPVDPFAAPGEADLTAHVDFGMLAETARAAGLEVQGPEAQGDWLWRLGIGARAESLMRANPDRRGDIEAAAHRLTAPEEMGTLFKVLVARAPEWPPGEGFASAD